MPRKYASRRRTCLLRRIGTERAPVGEDEAADEADLQRVDLRRLAWDDMPASGKDQTRRKASAVVFALPSVAEWNQMSGSSG